MSIICLFIFLYYETTKHTIQSTRYERGGSNFLNQKNNTVSKLEKYVYICKSEIYWQTTDNLQLSQSVTCFI